MRTGVGLDLLNTRQFALEEQEEQKLDREDDNGCRYRCHKSLERYTFRGSTMAAGMLKGLLETRSHGDQPSTVTMGPNAKKKRRCRC